MVVKYKMQTAAIVFGLPKNTLCPLIWGNREKEMSFLGILYWRLSIKLTTNFR